MTVKKALLAVAYGLGLLLLLGLGTWQINRGLEKADVLSKTQTGVGTYPTLSALPAELTALDYKKATLTGSWDEQRIILLDNRIYQNQLGYEVITPFKLNSEEVILVNRGWISHLEKANIPKLLPSPPAGRLYFPKKGYTIGTAIQATELNSTTWPKVSLYMDIESFSKALGKAISPLVMVLDKDHKNSLTRIWKPIIIQPERHYAYAMQWYGLAIVFIIFGLIWYRRGKRSTNPL